MNDSIRNRPVIALPAIRAGRLLDLATVLAGGTSVAILASSWAVLPELVVSHFDASGQVNGTLPRLFLWALIGFNIFIVTMLFVVSRFQHYLNFAVTITAENAERQYKLINLFIHLLSLELSLIFLFIIHTCITATLNPGQGLNSPILLTLVGLQTGTIIWYMQQSFKLK